MPISLSNLSCEIVKLIKRNTLRLRNLLQHIHWQKNVRYFDTHPDMHSNMEVRSCFPWVSEDKGPHLKQSDSKCSPGRKIKPISQQLAIDNCKRSNSELCRRLQNTFIEKSTSKFPTTFGTNDRTRKNNCSERECWKRKQ